MTSLEWLIVKFLLLIQYHWSRVQNSCGRYQKASIIFQIHITEIIYNLYKYTTFICFAFFEPFRFIQVIFLGFSLHVWGPGITDHKKPLRITKSKPLQLLYHPFPKVTTLHLPRSSFMPLPSHREAVLNL